MSGSMTDFRPTIEEALNVFNLIKIAFSSMANVQMTGSLRRKSKLPIDTIKDTVGDVDIIVVPHTLLKKANMKEMLGVLFGKHKNGKPKTTGLIGRIQVDFFFAKKETVGAVSLFYGLPRQLQIALRAIAAARGFRFGPKGVFYRHTYSRIDTPDETSVYKVFGIEPFSAEEMDRASSYIFREKLNKE